LEQHVPKEVNVTLCLCFAVAEASTLDKMKRSLEGCLGSLAVGEMIKIMKISLDNQMI